MNGSGRSRRSKGLGIAGLLALTLVLQACSSGGNNNEKSDATASVSPSASPSATPSASEEAKLEPYEVSIVYFGKPQQDDALVEEKLNEFFKEKINATVKLQPIASSEYKNRTELMMNAGEKMDLVFTASWLNYFGNVTIGEGGAFDLDAIQAMGVDATIVAVGAQGTKWLGLPGEDTPGVYHAKD
ncbi:MAG: hypothetical protein J7559_15940, partial [Cohnella sp.]|nr:hypothetical protein [Cohnella sp.]